MLIRHRGRGPSVDTTAWIAPTAVLVGDVSVGPRARILYGAVLSAEESRVEVGECAIVSENAVLRAGRLDGEDVPVIVGDHVFIGPHATLLGCRIGSCSYIATGAAVLQGSTTGVGSVVAIGAIVHARTAVPADIFVPPNCIAIGDPVRIYTPDEKVTLSSAIKHVRFGKDIFGIEAIGADRAALYREATEGRSAEYAEHANDAVIPTGRGEGGRGPR